MVEQHYITSENNGGRKLGPGAGKQFITIKNHIKRKGGRGDKLDILITA